MIQLRSWSGVGDGSRTLDFLLGKRRNSELFGQVEGQIKKSSHQIRLHVVNRGSCVRVGVP